MKELELKGLLHLASCRAREIAVRENVKASRVERVGIFTTCIRNMIRDRVKNYYDPVSSKYVEYYLKGINSRIQDVILDKSTWRDIAVINRCSNDQVTNAIEELNTEEYSEFNYDYMAAEFECIKNSVSNLDFYVKKFSSLNDESDVLFTQLNDLMEECNV